jgi:hypothetical protein
VFSGAHGVVICLLNGMGIALVCFGVRVGCIGGVRSEEGKGGYDEDSYDMRSGEWEKREDSMHCFARIRASLEMPKEMLRADGLRTTNEWFEATAKLPRKMIWFIGVILFGYMIHFLARG